MRRAARSAPLLGESRLSAPFERSSLRRCHQRGTAPGDETLLALLIAQRDAVFRSSSRSASASSGPMCGTVHPPIER
jgi:hypothetical protein